MLAAEFGEHDIAALLIKSNANIFLMQAEETALMKAVKTSQFSIVKLLIEKGIREHRKEKLYILRVPCGSGETIYEILDDDLQLNRALVCALNSNYIYDESVNKEIIKFLINSGVNLKNDKAGNIGNIALYLAIQKNYKDIVEELLDHRVELNAKCYGITPLMLAIKEDNLDIIALLIKAEAD
jgi:ankyrin repeat protein